MTPTTEPATTAAKLIDALLASGEAVDEGGFSLDAAAAAAKLDAFQFADRSAYLVPIAEAAALLDAEEARLETLGEDLVITLLDVLLPNPRRFLADPWARRQADPDGRQTRAWARLGVGLSMAVGHDTVERVVVSYSTNDETLTAEYRRGQPPRLSRAPLECPRELRIIIDRPWTDRLSLRGACHAELAQLRAAVAHAQVEFVLDNQRISRRARKWRPGERGQGSGPGYRWFAGLDSSSDAGRIELCVEQVRVETRPVEAPGFVAVIELDAPTRDLSQLAIVDDPTLAAALAEVERYRLEGLGDAPPAPDFEARLEQLGRGVKKARKGMLGLSFVGAGIVAGAIGFGMLFRGVIQGLLALVFLFSHGGLGASNVARNTIDDVDDQRSRTRLTVIIVVFAAIAALVLGFFGERLFR